jgi:hypothetical protein
VADLSSDGNLLPEGMHMIEAIEAQKSRYCPTDTGCHEKASEIMGYLREAFHGKVPRTVFRRKCAERGLNDDEIVQAELEFGQWLS